MADMVRDWAGYAGNPPNVEWPGGARIALNVVINFEEATEFGTVDGDLQVEAATEMHYALKPGERDLANEGMSEYGTRAGVWRILDLLDRYEFTSTVNAAALALERHPAIAEAFVKRGYDVIGHGYRWIPSVSWTEDQVREDVRKARESIQRTTGQRIIGWINRPNQHVALRRILAEEGFVYDSAVWNDDLPYFEDAGGKRILCVPYSLDSNDVRFWRPQHVNANTFFEYMRDTFDMLYEEGTTYPKMMSLGIHCRVVGRPGRARGLQWFLAHVRKHPKVWIAQRNDIANFWMEKYG